MNIARPFGIPLHLHWSFLLFVAAFAVWSGPSGLFATLAATAGLFGSVALHELGHALAARRYGYATDRITLYPFGGVASIQFIPQNPTQELVIALAGPMVNAVLFVGLLPLYLLTGWTPLLWLLVINLMLGLFNLVPAFPMDGGRVLRALLATQLGWLRASHLAIRIGSVFAWGFLLVGLATSWNLAMVGGFLLFALAGERRRLAYVARHSNRGRPLPT